MARTREQLEQAATEATDWLNDLDPADPNVIVKNTSTAERSDTGWPAPPLPGLND